MSNIKLNISINPGILVDADALPLSPDGSSNIDMLLSPFYTMEQDVIAVFADNGDEYFSSIRKIIFEASMKVDDILTAERRSYLQLSTQQAFRMKREYVTCMAIYKFGRIFYRDYLKSVKKSKFLADVKVSLEIEKEPGLIQSIAADAAECIEELEGLFGIGGNFGSFVKGRSNACNNAPSNREWFPSGSNGYPRVAIAASKTSAFCKTYKIGIK